MAFPLTRFAEWFQKNEEKIREDFFHFLRFQSISTDPSYKEECRKAAHWILDYLRSVGAKGELLESSGHPVVFAEIQKDPSFPTILLYHHYDVQPVDPIDLWRTDPFDPMIEEGKIFARGASDNKGQCFLTVTALKALQEFSLSLPLNIKIFIEGEEECGGKGTQEVLKKYADRLRSDYLCIVDFGLPDKDTPAIALGYRGVLTMHLECKNAKTDLHSGSHGSIALNPNRILVKLLNTIWNEKGKVTIPHFYDRVKMLSAEEKKNMDFSFDELQYRKDFGVGAFCSEEGATPKEANGMLPTVEINGMWGGYTGAGFKTVIPAKSYAKISCRLVPDQDPEEIFKNFQAFLAQNTPKGAEITLTPDHGAKGFRMEASSPLLQAVQKSMEEVFGKSPCKFILCGGAVPIVRDLMEASGAKPALFGFALDTDDVHAPNEHFQWECFQKGFLVIARLLWEISVRKEEC